MSTAFVFAPLSSLLRPEDRLRYRHLEEVQARFRSAAEILHATHGVRVGLDGLLDQPTPLLCARGQISLTAALVIAVQLGVVDRLQKFLPKPVWVVGCSLGDVARTVSAGACAFETALQVAMMSLFEAEEADRIGGTVVVMAPPRHPVTTEDLDWFTSNDITVSQLSARLLNVSGLTGSLGLLNDVAQERHWRIFPLLDFPLHSHHVACYAEKAQAMIRQVPFEAPAPGIRVYSSVLKREVKQPEDFREEFLGSLVLPHNWQETVNELIENHGVTSFVNIGPCRSLSRLLREEGQSVLEADDLIETNEAS